MPASDKAWLAEILCIEEDGIEEERIEEEGIASRDNPVGDQGLRLQLPARRAPAHDVKARVEVRAYPAAGLAVFHAPRPLARSPKAGDLIEPERRRAAA